MFKNEDLSFAIKTIKDLDVISVAIEEHGIELLKTVQEIIEIIPTEQQRIIDLMFNIAENMQVHDINRQRIERVINSVITKYKISDELLKSEQLKIPPSAKMIDKEDAECLTSEEIAEIYAKMHNC